MGRTELPAAETASHPLVMTPESDLATIAVERTRMPMTVTDPHQPDNPIIFANPAFCALSGYVRDEIVGRNCRFLQGPATDPAAIAAVRDAIAAEREITVDVINYRRDGSSFWNQLFISPIHRDGRLRYFFASQFDVTAERRARELESAEHRLLREVDHRAKNALALVQGIVRLTRADDAVRYSRAVQGRVDALAHAHALLSEAHWRPLALRRLLRAEVEPFGSLRTTLDGPDIEIPTDQVQPLALLFHELVANAAEHGGLSDPGGRLTIGWRVTDDRLAITLDESGGPQPGATRTPGLGLTMMDMIARRQLRGTLVFDWRAGGLQTALTVPFAGGVHAAR